MNNVQDNETYRRVHFAVMAIENGAKNMGSSGKEHPTLRDWFLRFLADTNNKLIALKCDKVSW